MRTWSLPLAVMLFCLLGLVACQREETADPRGSGLVESNPAYLENFGTPPQGKAGHAFARVGYLPLQTSPGKLRAFPLFLFDDQDQLQQILKRLTSDDLQLNRNSDLYNPFPGDLVLSITSAAGPTATISLTTSQDWSGTALEAGARALTETALQFATVERVVILLNGKPLPQMPAEGFEHDQALLVGVELPRLIHLMGVWEEGDAAVSELLVEFDRPIKVKQFKIYAEDGNVVDGDYFTSIVEMAVVIHPKDPGRYREGDVLRVEWEVVDELGRANHGTSSLPLWRIEH